MGSSINENLEETRTLMPGKEKSENDLEEDGQSSIVQSAFNLSNTIIGLGTVTIASGFSQAGLGLALFILVMVIAFSNYGFRLLARAAKVTSCYKYIEVGTLSTRRRAGGVAVEITLALYTMGSCVAYVRSWGDFIPPIARLFVNKDSVLASRYAAEIGVLVLVLPFAAQRTLHKLRFISYLAIGGILTCTIVVVMGLFHHGVAPDVSWWGRPRIGAFLAFPLFGVANTGQHNGLRVFYELKNRRGLGKWNILRFTWVTILSSGTCLFLYALIGTGGYLTFGSKTDGNILNNYNLELESAKWFRVLVTVARVCLALAIACSYPFPHYAARSAFLNVFWTGKKAPPAWLIALVSVLLSSVILLIALKMDSVATVFDFTGSTVGALMVYCFPALFFILLAKQLRFSAAFLRNWPSLRQRIYPWITMIVGLACAVTAFVLSVQAVQAKGV